MIDLLIPFIVAGIMLLIVVVFHLFHLYYNKEPQNTFPIKIYFWLPAYAAIIAIILCIIFTHIL